MNHLPEQTATERLAVYRHLTKACQHLYSKGNVQTEKMAAALQEFSPLTKNDPIFLAHLTAWAASEKNQSRDLHLLALYLNALNDGDGTPFVAGGTLRKPNYRLVTQALLNTLKPHQFSRLLHFNRLKWNLNGVDAAHFPRSLRTAMKIHLDSLSAATVKKHVAKQFRRHLIEAFMRLLEKDHKPEGWPAVQMREITALCDEIERLRGYVTKYVYSYKPSAQDENNVS